MQARRLTKDSRGYMTKASTAVDTIAAKVKELCDSMHSLVIDSASTGMTDIIDELESTVEDLASSMDSAKDVESLQKDLYNNLAKKLKAVVESEIDYLLESLGKDLYPFLKLVTHKADAAARKLDHTIKELESYED